MKQTTHTRGDSSEGLQWDKHTRTAGPWTPRLPPRTSGSHEAGAVAQARSLSTQDRKAKLPFQSNRPKAWGSQGFLNTMLCWNWSFFLLIK